MNAPDFGSQPQQSSVPAVLIGAGERALATEIDRQVATAKAYPRQLGMVLKQATDMVTTSPEVAGSCYYQLRRKDKTQPSGYKIIEGPSIRVVEIILSAWGNISAKAMIIEEGERSIVARGMAWDMEKNVSTSVDVRRNIWGNYGRYSDDMIAVTSQAAVSIALRNALLRVVPRVYVDRLVAEAKAVAAGEAMSIGERWQGACKAFSALGATPEDLVAYLGLTGPEDITSTNIADLRGLLTALRDGETTFDEAFPRQAAAPEVKPEPTATAAEAMKAKLREQAPAAPAPEPAPPKRPGRPAGSKNKPRPEEPPPADPRQEPLPVVKLTPYEVARDRAMDLDMPIAELEQAAMDVGCPRDPKAWTEQDAAMVCAQLAQLAASR
ncbi:MAG: hypothetical protein RBU35_20645 [Anaerolineae bacterium]|jgi:hypothetical protein|nr:hypothetical protein [Anaerolineae bacterium]